MFRISHSLRRTSPTIKACSTGFGPPWHYPGPDPPTSLAERKRVIQEGDAEEVIPLITVLPYDILTDVINQSKIIDVEQGLIYRVHELSRNAFELSAVVYPSKCKELRRAFLGELNRSLRVSRKFIRPVVGSMCCAYYDGIWSRVLIKRKERSGVFQAYSIDYGWLEYLSVSSFAETPHLFAHHEPMTIRIQFKDNDDSYYETWNTEEYFVRLVDWKEDMDIWIVDYMGLPKDNCRNASLMYEIAKENLLALEKDIDIWEPLPPEYEDTESTESTFQELANAAAEADGADKSNCTAQGNESETNETTWPENHSTDPETVDIISKEPTTPATENNDVADELESAARGIESGPEENTLPDNHSADPELVIRTFIRTSEKPGNSGTENNDAADDETSQKPLNSGAGGFAGNAPGNKSGTEEIALAESQSIERSFNFTAENNDATDVFEGAARGIKPGTEEVILPENHSTDPKVSDSKLKNPVNTAAENDNAADEFEGAARETESETKKITSPENHPTSQNPAGLVGVKVLKATTRKNQRKGKIQKKKLRNSINPEPLDVISEELVNSTAENDGTTDALEGAARGIEIRTKEVTSPENLETEMTNFKPAGLGGNEVLKGATGKNRRQKKNMKKKLLVMQSISSTVENNNVLKLRTKMQDTNLPETGDVESQNKPSEVKIQQREKKLNVQKDKAKNTLENAKIKDIRSKVSQPSPTTPPPLESPMIDKILEFTSVHLKFEDMTPDNIVLSFSFYLPPSVHFDIFGFIQCASLPELSHFFYGSVIHAIRKVLDMFLANSRRPYPPTTVTFQSEKREEGKIRAAGAIWTRCYWKSDNLPFTSAPTMYTPDSSVSLFQYNPQPVSLKKYPGEEESAKRLQNSGMSLNVEGSGNGGIIHSLSPENLDMTTSPLKSKSAPGFPLQWSPPLVTPSKVYDCVPPQPNVQQGEIMNVFPFLGPTMQSTDVPTSGHYASPSNQESLSDYEVLSGHQQNVGNIEIPSPGPGVPSNWQQSFATNIPFDDHVVSNDPKTHPMLNQPGSAVLFDGEPLNENYTDIVNLVNDFPPKNEPLLDLEVLNELMDYLNNSSPGHGVPLHVEQPHFEINQTSFGGTPAHAMLNQPVQGVSFDRHFTNVVNEQKTYAPNYVSLPNHRTLNHHEQRVFSNELPPDIGPFNVPPTQPIVGARGNRFDDNKRATRSLFYQPSCPGDNSSRRFSNQKIDPQGHRDPFGQSTHTGTSPSDHGVPLNRQFTKTAGNPPGIGVPSNGRFNRTAGIPPGRGVPYKGRFTQTPSNPSRNGIQFKEQFTQTVSNPPDIRVPSNGRFTQKASSSSGIGARSNGRFIRTASNSSTIRVPSRGRFTQTANNPARGVPPNGQFTQTASNAPKIRVPSNGQFIQKAGNPTGHGVRSNGQFTQIASNPPSTTVPPNGRFIQTASTPSGHGAPSNRQFTQTKSNPSIIRVPSNGRSTQTPSNSSSIGAPSNGQFTQIASNPPSTTVPPNGRFIQTASTPFGHGEASNGQFTRTRSNPSIIRVPPNGRSNQTPSNSSGIGVPSNGRFTRTADIPPGLGIHSTIQSTHTTGNLSGQGGASIGPSIYAAVNSSGHRYSSNRPSSHAAVNSSSHNEQNTLPAVSTGASEEFEDLTGMLQFIDETCTSNKEKLDCSKIRFYLSSLSTEYEMKEITSLKSLKDANFDSSLKTVVCSHGFISNVNSQCIEIIRKAVQGRGFNFIGIDWGDIAMNINYPYVAGMVRPVGHCVGKFLYFLITNTGLSLQNIHLVGHSLGAHVCGHAGKWLQTERGMKMDRITGVDPAGPCFNWASAEDRLDSNDAVFVDCIDTSKYCYGKKKSYCRINFLVHGGTIVQPPCKLLDFLTAFVCSHRFACDYFASSLNEENKFEGKCCPDEGEKCTIALMGYPANRSSCSALDVHVDVDEHPPYARMVTWE
ncbi:hypothetical protein GE061_001716 [Apolygus lucorum]|uniref:Lipase domain-containing protein n=1 Tax=Apolygus lucorum TaxID=248454 RepID=A0A8S9Y7V6_APOLU|nr:hypothetical protein GE061_001716 [Apolygus lucorum]